MTIERGMQSLQVVRACLVGVRGNSSARSAELFVCVCLRQKFLIVFDACEKFGDLLS